MARGFRSGAATLVVALIALLGAVCVAAPARASTSRAFGIRYQTNDTADILLRGNSLLTCPVAAANCTAAINRTATGAALNNNAYAMQFDNVDPGAGYSSSSSAAVSLPAGGSVLFAGLYWSGYSAAVGGRSAPPAGTLKNQLMLKVPGGSSYRTVTASNVDNGPSTGAPYVSFADVTGIVRTAGAGTYTGANIFADTGPDSYAAWSLVLVVHSPSYPQRNLTVFDGFGTVQNAAGDTTIDIPLSGLSTPPSGAVNARLGAVVFEGDAGSTGDQFQIIPPSGPTTTLTDAENPADNAFNSTNSDNGVEVPGRIPSGNTFGFDADVFQSNVLIGNSASTATLRLATGGETFFPAVATFESNIYAPRLDVVRSAHVTDTVPDGRTRPGDRITYTIDVTNNGSDTSVNSQITDAVPAGTTYVPGSLTVDGVSATDAADSDVGELIGSTLNVRLGTGAGGSAGSGGSIAPPGSGTAAGTTEVKYTVQITDPYTAGGTVTGSTGATYSDAAARNFSTSSNITSTTVDPARADLAVTNVAAPTLVQRPGAHAVTWTATVTNNGPDTETAPVLMQNLPATVTGVSISGASCTITSGTNYSCPLAALTSGATATVTFSATLPAAALDPSTATATVAGDGTDPTSANNSAAAAVGINTAPTAVDDTAPLNPADAQTDIDVLANDSDPDSGDTLAISSLTQPAHGSTSVVAGKIRYALTDTTFIGTDTFSYTVCDGRSGCGSANVTVTVANHRKADLAVTQTATPGLVQTGATSSITWTVNVTNNGPQDEPNPLLVENLPAVVTGVSVAGATCTNAGNNYSCLLSALANAASSTVTFTATLPAGSPDPSPATATISGDDTDPTSSDNVATGAVAVNTAPVAVDDVAPLNSPAAGLDIDVLGNDTDSDLDPLTISSVTIPAHGTATIVAGKIRYTLTDATFIGPDLFSYTVCDNRGGCDTANVTVPVNDHRRADLALTETATPTVVQRGGSPTVTWTVHLTNNGPQDEPSPQLVETMPAAVTGVIVAGAICTNAGAVYTCPLATLTSGAGTAVSFTATVPASAPDPVTASGTLSGTITDPDLSNNSATLGVGVNLPPLAVADTATLGQGVLSLDVDAAANDSDPDRDPLTITAVTTPAHGTATIVGGKIHYVLTDYSFTGNDALTYTVCDGRGGCTTATVTVTVANHQVADLGVTQSVAPKLLQRNGSRTATWTVTVTNAGPQTESLPVLVETLPAGAGAIAASLPACTTSGVAVTCALAALTSGAGTQITFTATLPADIPDPAAATATVSGARVDPNPADNTANAAVAVNTPPVAGNHSVSLPATSAAVTIDALAGGTDADGDPLALSSLQKPKHGTATIVNGKVVYTLTDLTFIGTDTFNYVVCDDRSGCDTAVISVQVANHGHPPVAVADSAKTLFSTPVTVDVTANDHDPDGAGLVLTRITQAPRHGTAELHHGRIRYTPDDGFLGVDTLHYEVCDPSGLCARATATIQVTSLPPITAPDTSGVRPGGTAVVDVLGNDVDPDGDPLGRVTIVRQPSVGTATVGSDGKIHYQAPASAAAGTKVTITYRTCDPTGACSDGTLQVTVAGSTAGGGSLAFTGGNFGSLLLIALALMLAGAMAIGSVRQVRQVRQVRRSTGGPAGRDGSGPPRRQS